MKLVGIWSWWLAWGRKRWLGLEVIRMSRLYCSRSDVFLGLNFPARSLSRMHIALTPQFLQMTAATFNIMIIALVRQEYFPVIFDHLCYIASLMPKPPLRSLRLFWCNLATSQPPRFLIVEKPGLHLLLATLQKSTNWTRKRNEPRSTKSTLSITFDRTVRRNRATWGFPGARRKCKASGGWCDGLDNASLCDSLGSTQSYGVAKGAFSMYRSHFW